MACGKIAFFMAALLATLAVTRAEEDSGSGSAEERASFQAPSGNFGFNMGSGSFSPFGPGGFGSLFGGGNGSSNPFASFLSAFRPNSGGNGTGSGSSFPFLPFLSGNRLEQVHAEHSEDREHEVESSENRLFFGLLNNLFSTPTSCNFTTQPGLTCLSCTQRLACYSTNTGRLTQCSFLTPYCNAGRCSKIPGAACFNTNSTAG